jgi:hypothetical protein
VTHAPRRRPQPEKQACTPINLSINPLTNAGTLTYDQHGGTSPPLTHQDRAGTDRPGPYAVIDRALLRLANSYPSTATRTRAFLMRPRAVHFATSTLQGEESAGANPFPCPLLDRHRVRTTGGRVGEYATETGTVVACFSANASMRRRRPRCSCNGTKRKVATGDTPISTYAPVD